MIIFPGGVRQKWNFRRGGGVHFVSQFWKIQRVWGVIGKIPSGGGYGYFLEPHIVSLRMKKTLCQKHFFFTLLVIFFGIFEPCLNVMSLLYDYCLIYGKYDSSFSCQSQPGGKYSCQFVTHIF